MLRLVLCLIPLLACVHQVEAQQILAGGRVAPDGKTEVAIDYPGAQKVRNTVGTNRKGLCVFSAINMSSIWQNEPKLLDFQEKMKREPGGGWPEKVDAMIAKYGSGTKYIQYIGKDLNVIKAVLRSGRMPSITYAGADGVFYNEHIYHMVNVLHLDEQWAAVMDNNYTGEKQVLWMTPQQLSDRWAWPDQGWLVALLAPPPPPIPTLGAAQAPAVGFEAGDPVEPNPVAPEYYQWRTPAGHPEHRYLYLGEELLGSWSLRQERWNQRQGDGWGMSVEQTPLGRPECDAKPIANYGVRKDLLPQGEMFIVNGACCSKRTALAAIAGQSQVPEDSHKLRVTVIGDDAFRQRVVADLKQVPSLAAWEEYVHVQSYPPEHWSVADLGFPRKGIVIQTPPGPDGRGVVLHQQRYYKDPEQLTGAIRQADKKYREELAPDLNQQEQSGMGRVPWELIVICFGVLGLILIAGRGTHGHS